MEPLFDVIDAGDGKFIKAWKRGVPFDEKTIEQLKLTARLPFVFKYVAAMADAHLGCGSTIGTVLPTIGAIVPAAVGVDIGCGMKATPLGLKRANFCDDLKLVRNEIERAVPHGRTNDGGKGDRGAWANIPERIQILWNELFEDEYEDICSDDSGARAKNTANHLGTLGTGNHFIELSEDETGEVWLVLHSGSRGLGNRIGSYFTNLAKEMCERFYVKLPAPELAYIPEMTNEFNRYVSAVRFAQRFAWENRNLMESMILSALGITTPFVGVDSVHCHHNYVSWEHHYGKDVMVTRKGAVRADEGMMGVIPGSMGARTYIVRGLGSRESFCTCSHGAGRAMSRTMAEKTFTVADHEKATEGVECDKTEGVLDETPGAYKDIEAVMAAQRDLVEPVHQLKQFLSVKGVGDRGRR